MADVTVRLATKKDVPQLVSLVRSLVESCGEQPPPFEDMARVIARQVEDEDHEYVVAENEGHVFGCVLVCYYLSTWAAAPYAMLQDFIVEEGWRNQGVGSTMLAYARNRARLRKCVRMDLIIQAGREDAKRFFKRWGFTPTDRELLRVRLSPPPAAIPNIYLGD